MQRGAAVRWLRKGGPGRALHVPGQAKDDELEGLWRGGAGLYSISCMAVVVYDLRPSHPYDAGTEILGFSPTRLALRVSSAKRREVSSESHEGRAASYQEALVRRTCT